MVTNITFITLILANISILTTTDQSIVGYLI